MTAVFTRRTRDLVDRRRDGLCEKCGIPTDTVQYHHRRARGMGSTRRPESAGPANCLAVCPPCHHVIESQRADALFAGFLVSQYADPATTPVWRLGQWVVLDDDGGWRVRV